MTSKIYRLSDGNKVRVSEEQINTGWVEAHPDAVLISEPEVKPKTDTTEKEETVAPIVGKKDDKTEGVSVESNTEAPVIEESKNLAVNTELDSDDGSSGSQPTDVNSAVEPVVTEVEMDESTRLMNAYQNEGESKADFYTRVMPVVETSSELVGGGHGSSFNMETTNTSINGITKIGNNYGTSPKYLNSNNEPASAEEIASFEELVILNDLHTRALNINSKKTGDYSNDSDTKTVNSIGNDWEERNKRIEVKDRLGLEMKEEPLDPVLNQNYQAQIEWKQQQYVDGLAKYSAKSNAQLNTDYNEEYGSLVDNVLPGIQEQVYGEYSEQIESIKSKLNGEFDLKLADKQESLLPKYQKLADATTSPEELALVNKQYNEELSAWNKIESDKVQAAFDTTINDTFGGEIKDKVNAGIRANEEVVALNEGWQVKFDDAQQDIFDSYRENFKPTSSHFSEEDFNRIGTELDAMGGANATGTEKKYMLHKILSELEEVQGGTPEEVEAIKNEYWNHFYDKLSTRPVIDDKTGRPVIDPNTGEVVTEMTQFAMKDIASATLTAAEEVYDREAKKFRKDNFIYTHQHHMDAAVDRAVFESNPGLELALKNSRQVIDNPEFEHPAGIVNFFKGVGSLEGHKYIPFVGGFIDLGNSAELLMLANKENKTPMEEQALQMHMIKNQSDQQVRKLSTAYNAGAMAGESLPFMGEMILTSGIYSTTKLAVQRGVKKALTKAINKKVKKKVAGMRFKKGTSEMLFVPKGTSYEVIDKVGDFVGFIAASAAQTTANPQRYITTTLDRMTPEMSYAYTNGADDMISQLDLAIEVGSKDNKALGDGEAFPVAFAKAFGLTWSEYATERMGEMLPGIGKSIMSKFPKAQETLKRIALGRYLRKMGFDKSEAFSHFTKNQVGWNGLLGEISEEMINIPLSNLIVGDDLSTGFEEQGMKEMFISIAASSLAFGGGSVLHNKISGQKAPGYFVDNQRFESEKSALKHLKQMKKDGTLDENVDIEITNDWVAYDHVSELLESSGLSNKVIKTGGRGVSMGDIVASEVEILNELSAESRNEVEVIDNNIKELESKKEEINQREGTHGGELALVNNEIADLKSRRDAVVKDVKDVITTRKKTKAYVDGLKNLKSVLGESKYNEIVTEAQDKTEAKAMMTEAVVQQLGLNEVDGKYFNSNGEQVDISEAVDGSMGAHGGFYIDPKTGKRHIVINKEAALEGMGANVAGHEFLHYVLAETLSSHPELKMAFGEALLSHVQNLDPRQIRDTGFRNRVLTYQKDQGTVVSMEETLNILADSMANGTYKYNETALTKLGDVIRRVLSSFGVVVKFETGRDVFNFVKDYNKEFASGKLSKGMKATIKSGGKIGGEVEARSKTVDLAEVELSDDIRDMLAEAGISLSVDNIYDELGSDDLVQIIESPSTTADQLASAKEALSKKSNATPSQLELARVIKPKKSDPKKQTPEDLVRVIKSKDSSAKEKAIANESLIKQFDLLALKALNYHTEKGDISRDEVLSAAREYLPGIIKRFNPETAKFSTFVTSNMAPKQAVIYEGTKDIFYGTETKSIDTEEAKQVEDTSATFEDNSSTPTKQKPKIDILKFSTVDRVIDKVKKMVNVETGDTFKQIISKYAGNIGELVFDIAGDKIMKGGANLTAVTTYEKGMPSPAEAQNIQRFFNAPENMGKFIKTLPLHNVTEATADINKIGENIDVSRDVHGVAIGLKGLPMDYFYENYIDPKSTSTNADTRKQSITSPKGRSKGLTSQTQVKRLKPEFRNPTLETIEKTKQDIGIMPKLQQNTYSRDIGQLLKGFAKTYSINASLSAAQRSQEIKLDKAIESKKAEIKQQTADITTAQSKVAFSVDAVDILFSNDASVLGSIERHLPRESRLAFWSGIKDFAKIFGGKDIYIDDIEAVRVALETIYSGDIGIMSKIEDLTKSVHQALEGSKVRKNKVGRVADIESIIRKRNTDAETKVGAAFNTKAKATELQADIARQQRRRDNDVLFVMSKWEELKAKHKTEKAAAAQLGVYLINMIGHSASSTQIADKRFIPNSEGKLIDNPDYEPSKTKANGKVGSQTFRGQSYDNKADFVSTVIQSIKDANGKPLFNYKSGKVLFQGEIINKGALRPQKSIELLLDVKEGGTNLDIRKQEVVNARNFLNDYVKWHVDKYKAGIIDNSDLAMVATALLSHMDSSLARAGMPAYIADGMYNTKEKLVYEHMQPRVAVILSMFDAHVNGTGISDVNDFLSNYEVAIIPKSMDDVLKAVGLNSALAPGQTLEMAAWLRYFNDLTFGRPEMLGLNHIVYGKTEGQPIKDMSRAKLTELGKALKLNVGKKIDRTTLVDSIRAKLKTDYGSLFNSDNHKKPARFSLKQMTNKELVIISDLMNDPVVKAKAKEFKASIGTPKKSTPAKKALIEAIETQRVEDINRDVNSVLNIIIKPKAGEVVSNTDLDTANKLEAIDAWTRANDMLMPGYEMKMALTRAAQSTMNHSIDGTSKGASIWDFDDTLARTKSGVRYKLPNPSGNPQPGRKVIFMAGGAGSGKSGVLKQLGLEGQGYKTVNQDISLEWLKKNAGLPTDMRDLTPEQLSEVNKLAGEARRIAKRKQGKFKGNGDGVVIDGTGGSLNVIKKKVQEFKDAGYDVQMIFVETSLDVAQDRNANRKERSLSSTIVAQNHKAVQGNKEGFKELFGDNFAEVNTDKLAQGEAMPSTFANKVNKFTNGYINARLDAGQFAHVGADLLAQGATFDFSEFSLVKDGSQGPLFQEALSRAKKYGTKDQFVLTARPMAAAPHIQQFLKEQGLDIPIENITGLESSSADSKALWIAEKIGEGYNDIYFADDHLANVTAVSEMLDQHDVKGKVVQAKVLFSKDAEGKFNEILERVTGVNEHKEFSGAVARLKGASKGKNKFFVPPSAEDFKGLIYSFLGKGKDGDADMAWFKEHLLDPFSRGIKVLNATKQSMSNEYKALRKAFPNVINGLNKKVGGTDFTLDAAIRVYLWNKSGFEVPGLSKSDLSGLLFHMENDASAKAFANVLGRISRRSDGYIKPSEYWVVESIASDLHNVVTKVNRAEFLSEWIDNKDLIFSDKNLNKIEAVYGTVFREALENILFRMQTGSNRIAGQDKLVSKFTDWINGSVGAVMFFNTRSAVLQTLSVVNFIDWNDNNLFKSAGAFANQKQYWADFGMLFNSDMLKQRRAGMEIDVSISELTEAVSGADDKAKAALRYLLQIGFTPTQVADSFAIAAGGSTFYRNKVKRYVKEGMSKEDAESKAFNDFQEIAEETQQSSRPDMISQQQSGVLGRLILAWQNTPMQYTRLTKKAISDLANGRGDWRSHVSRIIYYGLVQNVIFGSLQSGLAFMMFGGGEDEEDERRQKLELRVANGALDTILRGTGIYGAMVSTLKNTIMKYYEQKDKGFGKQDLSAVGLELIALSPPISSKVKKIVSAVKTYEWNEDVIDKMGVNIDNPMYGVVGSIVEGATNIPLNRVVKKLNNLDEAVNGNHEVWQRVGLVLGWDKWSLGIKDVDVEKARTEVKEDKAEAAVERREVKKAKNKKIKEDEAKAAEAKKKASGIKEVRCSGTKSDGKRCSLMIETKAKTVKCSYHKSYGPKEASDTDGDGVKEYQCISKTGSGSRCKNRTERTNKRCYAHQ